MLGEKTQKVSGHKMFFSGSPCIVRFDKIEALEHPHSTAWLFSQHAVLPELMHARSPEQKKTNIYNLANRIRTKTIRPANDAAAEVQ